MEKITYNDIKEAIRKVLIPGSDLAMVHSSIGMFGVMDGLVDSCIDAWMEEADKCGYTVALPTFSWSYCRTRLYHYKDTPAETGVFPDEFRRRNKVLRGNHPIFSFAGYGPKAKDFVAHNGLTCWGADTPFEYLLKNNGLLIMFGVGWEYLTFYHHIEETKLVPYHYWKTFRGKADYGYGQIEVAPMYRVRSLRLPSGSDFSLIHNTLEKEGKMNIIRLGDGYIKSLRAKDIFELGCKLTDKDPFVFLKEKECYLEEIKRPFFVFLGSGNLDIITAELEKVFEDTTLQKCRTMNIAFGRYRRDIIDADSDLRLEKPGYVVFAERAEDIFPDTGTSEDKINELLYEYIECIKQSRRLLNGVFLVMNFSWLGDFDTYQYSVKRRIIDHANEVLEKEINGLADTYILPYSQAVEAVGRNNARPGKYWFIGRVPFSADLNKKLCEKIAGAHLFLEGKTVRIIITDLDNTLWGGVIGEDGIAGIQLGTDYPGNCYTAYQKFLKILQAQGKILAIASKNTEVIALDAIERHPDMLLRKKDFVDFRINWNNKAENIKEICNDLNLGLASVCFIDDNPAEREQIRELLPEVFVPDLPKDVSDWVPFLSDLPQFEVLSLIEEDIGKTERYARRAILKEMKEQSVSLDDFYRNLEMKLFFYKLSETNENRILQLLAKTNQFNTTTQRYKQNDLRKIASEGGIIAGIGLNDRFTPLEIIGVVILTGGRDSAEMIIDSLLLSCRVLGRNLEEGIFAWITGFALDRNKKIIRGRIIPTEKNIPVRNIYSQYGFLQEDNGWFSYDLNKGAINMPGYFAVNGEIGINSPSETAQAK